MIKTPCIGRCTCTLGDEVCKGCGRTADQVRDWNGYSEEQKAAVIKECKKSPAGMTETNGALTHWREMQTDSKM